MKLQTFFRPFVPVLFLSLFSNNSFSQGSKDSVVLNDSHFHLTNYVQEGTDIKKFLEIMGNKVGRVALFGIPQAESIVMTGDQSDILHSSVLCSAHPFLRIKVNGIENMDEPLVFFYLDIPVIHHPFAMT